MRADKTYFESLDVIDSKGRISSEYKKNITEKENELASLEDKDRVKEQVQKKQAEWDKRISEAQGRLKEA
jgi:hypothetical protein